MESKVVAMLVPQDHLNATMLVRRSNGQFAFERIDARVAAAARTAARWSRKGMSVVNLAASDVADGEFAQLATA